MLSLLLIGGVGVGLIAIKAIRGSSDMVQTGEGLLAEYEPPDKAASPPVGPTYRNVCALEGYPTIEGAETLYELFSRSVERFANNPCLGTRPKVSRNVSASIGSLFEACHAFSMRCCWCRCC